MPKALKAKKARELDRHNTLGMDDWHSICFPYRPSWQLAILETGCGHTRQTLHSRQSRKCYFWFPSGHTDVSTLFRRAKHLGLPTSSRQVPLALKPRSLFSGTTLYPRRKSFSSEDHDIQAEAANPVVPIRRPTLFRAPFIPKSRSSEKGEPHSECASSVTRQPSPVRSIVSMPDHRSRSPVSGSKPPSVADSDRLWDAIRRVGQPRRSRNTWLWSSWFSLWLNYYLSYCLAFVSYMMSIYAVVW